MCLVLDWRMVSLLGDAIPVVRGDVEQQCSFPAVTQARTGTSAASAFGRRQYTALTQRLFSISINSAAQTVTAAATAIREKDLIAVRRHGEDLRSESRMSATRLVTITRRMVLFRVWSVLAMCLQNTPADLARPELFRMMEWRVRAVIEVLQVIPSPESLTLSMALSSGATSDAIDK
jgi:hypothetical protein